jgi:hypothetical protein
MLGTLTVVRSRHPRRSQPARIAEQVCSRARVAERGGALQARARADGAHPPQYLVMSLWSTLRSRAEHWMLSTGHAPLSAAGSNGTLKHERSPDERALAVERPEGGRCGRRHRDPPASWAARDGRRGSSISRSADASSRRRLHARDANGGRGPPGAQDRDVEAWKAPALGGDRVDRRKLHEPADAPVNQTRCTYAVVGSVRSPAEARRTQSEHARARHEAIVALLLAAVPDRVPDRGRPRTAGC